MKKNNSIHTIAKDLGLSATTISFVINGKARDNRISDKVIEKVESHLSAINYKPNVIAQSLRTGKSSIVGMMVEDISDPFFSAIARGVEKGLEGSGYKMLYLSSKNEVLNAKTVLGILREYRVDAFVLAPSPGLEEDVALLLASGKPVILFDRYFPCIPTYNITIDNKGGAYSGTLELLKSGYKNVAFVTLKSEQIQMTERRSGYAQALADYGQPTSFLLEVPYNLEEMETAVLVKEFLQQYPNVEALLFATNYLAIAGLLALKDMKLKAGRDIGMVGFDDNTHFALFSPSVTAIAQPVSEISKAIAAQLLAALTQGKKCRQETVTLPVSLITRESSAGKRNNFLDNN